METSVRIVLLVCSLAAAGLAACAGTGTAGVKGTLSRHSIEVGDRDRSYLLYTPARAEGGTDGRPLIVVFHGGGGTARGIAREVGPSLHAIADRETIYVAYPDAVDKMWDLEGGRISNSLDVRIDDRAFFDALLDELLETQAVDPGLVFATGISRGGQASYFVACRFPDRIRAIAPVAMPMPAYIRESCDGDSGMGVAILNGTEDPLVPYDGGPITVGRRERDIVLSTADTIEFWRKRNACSSEPSDRRTIDAAGDGMRVHRTSWEECERDPVVLYRIEGGGHTWPSGRQYLPRLVIGPVNRDIDGAQEIWTFFGRFRREPPPESGGPASIDRD